MTQIRFEPCVVGRDSAVSMRVMRTLIHALERANIPRQKTVETARIDPELLDDPDARLPRTDFYRLCEAALDLTGDPGYGLRFAEELAPGAMDPLATLALHSETLSQALETLPLFHRLLCDDLGYQLAEHRGKLVLRCVPLDGASPRVERFLAELTITRFLRLVQSFSRDALPERVCLAYPAPAYRDEYARVFQGRAHFDEPFTGMLLDRALLDTPSSVRDAELHESLRVFVERRIASMTQGIRYSVRVRDLLLRHGVPRRVSMPEIARALGLSDRTLRRRLESEGSTFAEVVTDALSSAAKRCLCEGQRTIQETAHDLGFTDKTAFHRAFKRWTGTTPASFRREHEDDDGVLDKPHDPTHIEEARGHCHT